MVTVYGETTNALDTDYATQMSVVVKDQNGTTVASGNDYQLWNDASVALEFQGNPGPVYTAPTNHCLRLQSWSYDFHYLMGLTSLRLLQCRRDALWSNRRIRSLPLPVLITK
jgi:hypothetical protein